MSAESFTEDGVLAQIAEDPRFRDVEERCAVYRSLAERGGRISAADYAGLMGGACAAYPLADWVRD
jgi:hypothetical protein